MLFDVCLDVELEYFYVQSPGFYQLLWSDFGYMYSNDLS